MATALISSCAPIVTAPVHKVACTLARMPTGKTAAVSTFNMLKPGCTQLQANCRAGERRCTCGFRMPTVLPLQAAEAPYHWRTRSKVSTNTYEADLRGEAHWQHRRQATPPGGLLPLAIHIILVGALLDDDVACKVSHCALIYREKALARKEHVVQSVAADVRFDGSAKVMRLLWLLAIAMVRTAR